MSIWLHDNKYIFQQASNPRFSVPWEDIWTHTHIESWLRILQGIKQSYAVYYVHITCRTNIEKGGSYRRRRGDRSSQASKAFPLARDLPVPRLLDRGEGDVFDFKGPFSLHVCECVRVSMHKKDKYSDGPSPLVDHSPVIRRRVKTEQWEEDVSEKRLAFRTQG